MVGPYCGGWSDEGVALEGGVLKDEVEVVAETEVEVEVGFMEADNAGGEGEG